ncbi:putative toxin-antitoxin system toxin component, PIN family [Pasteurellaceae bacterium RH1A]|nr:putative toxin-antitoxin system toxin component, PIN family [Pasteurellaceae bacterium RH1A]
MPNNKLKQPIVVDTNVLISAILSPKSLSALALKKALIDYDLYLSKETFSEFLEVIQRDKFKKFLNNRLDERDAFIKDLQALGVFIEPSHHVHDCRDPKDNKFLSLALSCKAIYLVSGDKDLTVLNPYKGPEILTPAEFLEK